MAWIKFKRQWRNHAPGDKVDRPVGFADTLVNRNIAEPCQPPPSDKIKAAAKQSTAKQLDPTPAKKPAKKAATKQPTKRPTKKRPATPTTKRPTKTRPAKKTTARTSAKGNR